MGAPRLIHDQRLAAVVALLRDTGQVGAGAIRAWADDQGTGSVRVAFPFLGDLFR